MTRLNENEASCLEGIREFANNSIAPAAAAWTKGKAPDPQLFVAAADLGLIRLEVPVADGGLGHSFALKAVACEVLAAADFGFAMSVVNTHNVALKLASCGSPALKSEHLPALLWGQASACTALTEPGAGSDFAAIEMRAIKVSDGWVLDGEKTWITNARNAALAVVYAQCGNPGDSSGIGAFLVDLTAPDCHRHAISSDFAQSSSGTGGFTLSGYQVPEDHLLVAPGEAFKSILNEINGARVYVSAMCCGMLDAALTHVSAYGAKRKSFGLVLSAHQGWRLPIAQAETDLAAARALMQIATNAIIGTKDAQLSSAQAKINAVAACQTHLPVLLHAMGAEGLRQSYPFARHLAAAQIAALVDGSTEMLLERVARLARPQPQTKQNR